MRPIAILHSLLALSVAGSLACASAPKPTPETSRVTAPASASASAPAATSTPAPAPAPTPEPGPAAAPRAPDAIETGLVFAVEPLEAEIAIDGRATGTVADLAGSQGLLRLAPGIYQVSLKATGYVTWRAEVALRAGTETIRVKLAKKP